MNNLKIWVIKIIEKNPLVSPTLKITLKKSLKMLNVSSPRDEAISQVPLFGKTMVQSNIIFNNNFEVTTTSPMGPTHQIELFGPLDAFKKSHLRFQ